MIYHDYNALWDDYKKIKDKWHKTFTNKQRENNNSCLSKTFDG